MRGADGKKRTETTESPTDTEGPARPPSRSGARARRRRMAAAAWVCAVAAAFLLGAWSFAHADPGGQYGRPEPLTEAGVEHELTQAQQRASARAESASPGETGRPGDPAAPPSDPSSSPSSPSAPSSSESGPKAPRSTAHTATVRFPDGLGTAVAECRTDARTVKLLSWSPAEGYSADDIEAGPALKAGIELEPASDDDEDRTVLVRCTDGKPHAAFEKDDDDDD